MQACLSAADDQQFLLNASPDLRLQIEAEPALQPSAGSGARSTPIAGIVLTSADLDQVLGLLLLREFQPLVLYATPLVRRILEANSFFRMLQRVPHQLTWRTLTPDQPFTLGQDISCTAIALGSAVPHYAGELAANDQASEASIGLLIESGGRRLAYTPSLPAISEALLALYHSCDAILVDGTFWSDDELQQTHAGTPLARAIGHLPMSGSDGTMATLTAVTRPRKIFVHINNTNPALDPQSAERKLLEDAGWQVASDGWEWN